MTMIDSPNLPTRIRQHLTQAIQQYDSNVAIQVKRTSLGWLHLQITSSVFEGMHLPDREHYIDKPLKQLDLHLGSYPFIDYTLQTPAETEQQTFFQPAQLPLWSDILMAPEPDNPVLIDAIEEENTAKRPFIATFYSFKGGVGRSTALGCVANLLASRGKRIVMIDFDLEAPGLSFMFPANQADTNLCGVLDYIHQRNLTPDENVPTIQECMRQIEMPGRGELYLIPAGAYDEDYIHRLADLDIRLFYQRETNPIHQMLEDVKSYLEPDVILIDARTGFTEMGAIALFDRADLGIICFSPTSQSFAGLQWVVAAARKQRSYYGIPDLRFLLTPMPPVARSQQQQWLVKTAEWIADHWDAPASVTIDELYYQIPYNTSITMLLNLTDDIPLGMLEPYMPVADAISGSLSDKVSIMPKLADSRQKILSELIELKFENGTAQEIDAASIPTIFQRTGDFTRFLQDRTWLVRGAKGTGKTLLFRLFIERPNDARQFAQPDSDLSNVTFIPGHGPTGLRPTLLTSSDLESYEQQAGQDSWASFWHNYLLLQLLTEMPQLRSLPLNDTELVILSKSRLVQQQHSAIVKWLVDHAKSSHSGPQAFDDLRMINSWFKTQRRKVWVFYDELDIGFRQDYERRRRSLEALIGWWAEFGAGLDIIPKILLREDIWAALNFTNKAHFSSRFVQLQWEESDLWRLVLRRILNQSKTFADLLRQQSGIELGDLGNLALDQLRISLYPLWNERMGRVNKAYTHNWVRKRISDSKNNSFPRSLIQLLQKSVEVEKGLTDRNPYDSVLRPRSLIEALPFVSTQRVADVRNEYYEFVDLLDKLNGERSPISLERLGQRWGKEDDELKSLIVDMTEAGILQEYLRTPENEGLRYSVAELYLSGLGMRRQGQR